MAVFPLPRTPSRVSMFFDSFARVFESPFSGFTQAVDQSLQKWEGELIFLNRNNELGGPELMAWIAKMEGPINRFTAGVSDNPKRGAYGGTPLIDGIDQTGKVIQIRGAAANITNWIREGDYFGWVGPQGNPELHICTQDATSSGAGIVIISHEPDIRVSPADGAAVTVDDGILGKPQGTFLIPETRNGWNARPGGEKGKPRDMTVQFREDVFANVA